MLEQPRLDMNAFSPEPARLEDDRTPLALAMGLIAALAAGGLWAALVFVTDMEIGWAAWGVGGLVGLAMSKVTVNRSRQLALAAAGFAVLGLVAGKAFIFGASSGTIAEAIEADPAMMRGALAWQMYDARELDAATLAAVDDAQAAGDTLSNALWDAMGAQAGARLERMGAEERSALASSSAQAVVQSMGLLGGVMAQLTFFDLLWLFLAVGTAFRMMAAREGQPALEPAATV
jgi:hypothetical protein